MSSIMKNVSEEEKIHVAVEKQPEFPGGQTAFSDYLFENLKSGLFTKGDRIVVGFIVEKDGSLSDVKLLWGGYSK